MLECEFDKSLSPTSNMWHTHCAMKHFALQLMLTKSHLFLVDLLDFVLMYFAKEEVSVVFLSCLLGTIKSIEIDEN